ncbi:MAG TPA: hypothetical protein ENK55_11430 [Actinobacteria bacterium]|nr:hypothetical protein [Actinomycetota bacterium]
MHDEPDRWLELYRATEARIRRYLARYLPADEVPTALADVYLTAWVRRDRLAECSLPLAWLLAVADGVVRHRTPTPEVTTPPAGASTGRATRAPR